MPAPTNRPGDRPGGWLSWEATRVATGEVLSRGQRDLRADEFEVMVTPPRPKPQLSRLRLGPRQTAGDLLSWVFTRGRARSVKRVRLGGGFWLALPEHPGPAGPAGMALQAVREGEGTFCWEWFETEGDGSTGTKRQETGALALTWALNRDGNREVVGTSFVTDVSLRLRGADDADRDNPTYRVRVLAGSVVRWPQAADGIQLVPRLRPDHPHHRGPT